MSTKRTLVRPVVFFLPVTRYCAYIFTLWVSQGGTGDGIMKIKGKSYAGYMTHKKDSVVHDETLASKGEVVVQHTSEFSLLEVFKNALLRVSYGAGPRSADASR